MEFFKKWFYWLTEASVILITLALINNFLEQKEQLINADGKGYYDYLPAAFIYHDLNFNYTDTLETNYYDQKTYSQGYLKQFKGYQINKYFPGVAFLWIPFFEFTHIYTISTGQFAADGYSYPYQQGVLYAAFFYLFFGLIFLRLLLLEVGISRFLIFFLQLLFVLGTPLLFYVFAEPAFTHSYSFTLITAFSYFIYIYVKTNQSKWLFISAILLGLITIIRPVNLLAFGMIFLFFDSFQELVEWSKKRLSGNKKPILIALFLFVGVVSSVPIMWYHQTNHFFVWGYQEEGFNFLTPAFWSFLFSFQKGAFLHTPILFVAFFGGLFTLLKTKRFYVLFATVMYFSVIIYVLSSWHAWWYGASFGSRPMIDFYVLLIILMAVFIKNLKNSVIQMLLGAVLLFLTVVNVIQINQYQNYIIDWGEMTFEKFKIIGLHTEKKYRGVFFREESNYKPEEVRFTMDVDAQYPLHLGNDQSQYFSVLEGDSVIDLSQVNFVYIEADMEYTEGNCEFVLSINDTNDSNIYWHTQSVFASTLVEHKRTGVKLPYKIQALVPVKKIVIGFNPMLDEVILYNLQLVFVHRD